MSALNALARMLVLVMLLAGCGGGGGDDTPTRPRNTISLSRSSLTFDTTQGATSAGQAISVTFSGAGVAVGSRPGESVPGWLQVSAPSATSSSPVSVTLTAVASGLAPGTYSTVLRFATANADLSDSAFVDLPITLNYLEGFSISGPGAGAMSFSGFLGAPSATAPSSIELNIRGGAIAWEITGVPAWLDVMPRSGNAAATVRIGTVGNLDAGTYEQTLQLRETRNGISLFLPVTYTVRAAQLRVNRDILSFPIESDSTESALRQSIVLSDEANGALGGEVLWSASSDSPWLQLSSSAGTTSPSTTLTASIPRDQLEILAPGYRRGKITLVARDRAAAETTLEIPVDLTLNLPLVRAANPYLIAPATTATTRIRGEGMRDEDLARLRVGSIEPLNIRRQQIVDEELLFDVGASGAGSLPAGRHLVRFENALGLTRSTASVVVGAPVVAGPGTILSVANRRSRLIYDAERGRLYAGVVVGGSRVQIFEWSAGTSQWAELPAVPALNGLNDMDIDRAGRRLILAMHQSIGAISLDGTPTASVLHMHDAGNCNTQPNRLRTLDDDDVLVSLVPLDNTPACRALPVVRFDLVRNEFVTTTTGPYAAALLAPDAARRRMFLGPVADPAQIPVRFFESLSKFESGPSFGGLMPLRPRVLEANNDREHIVIDNTEVWDLFNNRRETLPTNRLTLLSPDGTRAYSYIHSNTQSRRVEVRAIDWSQPSFPVVQTLLIGTDLGDIPIDNPTPGEEISIAMTLSDDGQLLFVSGLNAIEVLATP